MALGYCKMRPPASRKHRDVLLGETLGELNLARVTKSFARIIR